MFSCSWYNSFIDHVVNQLNRNFINVFAVLIPVLILVSIPVMSGIRGHDIAINIAIKMHHKKA
jgi:uncharacterized protein (DUF983 family)